MNASTITVHWHNDNQPIYSVDFQPSASGPSPRLVTGGGDNNIRVWKLHHKHDQYLSTLRKHTQAVNVVRFNPLGTILATAGDDGTLILWKLADRVLKDFEAEDEDDDDVQESWQAVCQFRSSTSEINDICWSSNSRYLVTGSMDNITRVYHIDYANDKVTGTLVTSSKNHNHYIQGVYWDPLDQYIVTQSADRSVCVYRIVKHKKKDEIEDIKLAHRFLKFNNQHLYHSETLQSFFRRLCFSPDGSLVITPAGLENDSTAINTVYVYSRYSLLHTPIYKISNLNKPAIAVAFNPFLYEPSATSPVLKLAYKMIFAVATHDSILIYDTENFKPLGYVSNLHYSSITDLKWDSDGTKIIVSSTDGFCSIISFDDNVFGQRYAKKEEKSEGVPLTVPVTDPPTPVATNSRSLTPINNLKALHLSSDVGEIEDYKSDFDSSEAKDVEMISGDTSPEVEIVEIISEEETTDVAAPSMGTIDKFFMRSKELSPNKDKNKRRVVPTLVNN
ncbi:predicted protein [Scheffersomyces stipitis CBS 6054]|uniref:CAF1B/HIR1 beta-propeller domain-containing protein n=1 Tax=Scheffersomyces stipitis (strain ATCC 58785 / CBS 6054 / NBRC 10063 / NRRL Y-11545) TaxID=322104 RepID=A3LVB4_PICST|nr:predicted protein [Scheffersomyces stipitis CBS 6054]ABN67092.2 predicted protein [Scheffersomyces stipitis CBS 6054]